MVLSKTQKEVLQRLGTEYKCAYELKASMATLDALEKKGLATSKSGLGAIFSPRTSIEYKLTPDGEREKSEQANGFYREGS